MKPVRRSVLLLALLSLFVVQVAATVAASGLGCVDDCSDDAPLGCSGDDGCCTCCFHPRPALPQAVVVAHADRTWSDVLPVNHTLPLASPREILHVPKRAVS